MIKKSDGKQPRWYFDVISLAKSLNEIETAISNARYTGPDADFYRTEVPILLSDARSALSKIAGGLDTAERGANHSIKSTTTDVADLSELSVPDALDLASGSES